MAKQNSIRLVLGDCWEKMKEIPDGLVDMVLTDPPYGLKGNEISGLVGEFRRICQGHILVFCPPENQFPAASYLFWAKPTSTKNFSRNHGRFVEMIAHVQKGETWNQLFWANMTGLYTDILEGKRIHPHQKPQGLIERLVRIHTNPNDLVFDPFMGGGTTGVACRILGRNFMGIESEEEYFNLAKERIKWQSKN